MTAFTGRLREVSQPGGPVDGVSFVPLLRGQESTDPARALIWHFPHSYDQFPYSAIRRGPWKLIYYHADAHYALFNIESDIAEEHDRYREEPKVAEALADALADYLRTVKADMPTVRETGEPVPYRANH